MASACALAMNSGRITYISRLSRSAERSKRYFHGKGRRGKQVALPATPLFPKETGVADAVSIYAPSGENGFQERPQTFLKPEIKITFPLNMARAQRRPFSIVLRLDQLAQCKGVDALIGHLFRCKALFDGNGVKVQLGAVGA